MNGSPRKILVIMLRRIGDVLLTTPAARALKRRFPQAELHFLAEPPADQVLAGNPYVDRVIAYAPVPGRSAAASYWDWLRRVRAERYDWVIDYMGNPRSAILAFASGAPLRAGPAHVFHRWAYNHKLVQSPRACYAGLEKIRVLSPLGANLDETDFLPELRVPADAVVAAERSLAAAWPTTEGPLVGLIPASRKETRRWPTASYGELGRRLAQETGARLLVFWGPGERALADEVAAACGPAARVAPETRGLADLAALLGRCRLVVTNCNGPKHIAVARGTPTLTIHSSSDPSSWTPPHPLHRAVRRDELHCIGCRLNECPYDLECLRGLSVERVLGPALELLRQPAEASR